MESFYALSPAEQTDRLRELAVQALAQWGIDDAELDVIKFRENAVFRVITRSGERYALRVHRHGYHDDAELSSELRWLEALDRDGIDVPKVVPTLAGTLFATVNGGGVPETRQVDLFEWLEGEQLGSVEGGVGGDRESLRKVYRTIGEIAARVHNQATAWRAPAGFVRKAWDAAGLTGEQPLWGAFWELAALSAAERDLLSRARREVHRDLAAFGRGPDRYGLIHADFCAENLLVAGDRVTLIDFDDAGYGWHLFELATSLYFQIGEDHFDTIRDAVIDGYRSRRPLSDEQLEHLPLFFVARGFTYLGWVHTRSETETARELTPMLIERVCPLAEEYLRRR